VSKLQSHSSALADKAKEWETLLIRKEKALKDTKSQLAALESTLQSKEDHISRLADQLHIQRE
jgi:septal ring factor EnvC (AmiA/AmiB activator)